MILSASAPLVFGCWSLHEDGANDPSMCASFIHYKTMGSGWIG
jgi:hypothetical protein